MDLGCLEKYKFSTALLENSRKHHGIAWFSVNSHNASPLGPLSGLAVNVPSLAGQTLTREERVWSNSNQTFVLHTRQWDN